MEESLGLTRKHLVYLIVFIVAVLILMFVPPQFDRLFENRVKEDAHTVQQAMNVYSALNGGFFPEQSNLSALNHLMPKLPVSEKSIARFTKHRREIVAGAAVKPGQIGIAVHKNPAGNNTGYTITGFGRNAIIITLKSELPEQVWKQIANPHNGGM